MNKPSLTPFSVDPEILSCIRKMEKGDVNAVAGMHAAMMGNTLWGKLGVSFLQDLYSALLSHPGFIAYVYEDETCIGGFIAGSDNGPQMMKDVFKTNTVKLALATLKGLVQKPSAAGPLMTTALYFKKSSLPGLENVTAESMFCAFRKELRGKRISGLINKVLFDELFARGHRYVKITTEADNQGAIRQLTSWGFEQMGQFQFYGKEMIAWRLDLASSERISLPSDSQ